MQKYSLLINFLYLNFFKKNEFVLIKMSYSYNKLFIYVLIFYCKEKLLFLFFDLFNKTYKKKMLFKKKRLNL